MLMKWKSLFAAALTAAVAWPALAQESTGGGTPSLSFSFANGRSGARTTVMPTSHESLGIHSVPVAQWIDLDDEDVSANNLPINATDVVQVGDSHANFTLPAPVYVSYSAANGWSHKGTDTRTILQTYLDDGNNGASILVKNVPFTKYDVIVYLATDNVNAKFRPVTINGTRYAWTQFGTTENPWSNWSTKNTGTLIVNADANATFGRSQQDVANLGQNAIRVDGLETQTLTIQGSTGIQNNNTGRIERCGIAAIQIIQASDGAIRDTATYQPVISVNMKGNVDSIVGTSGFSGLNPTLNAYWNELSASGNSESGVGFADDLGLATTLAIDATYAGELWNVASAGRSTLGDMANGYRDTKQLTLTAVPYSSYDVILYFASDLHGGEGASAKPWTPVQVTDANGASKWYSYPADYTVPENGAAKAADANPGDWGTTADCHTADTAVAYGKAVMKIAGLSGDVTLSFLRNTDGNDSTNRSGLYGFQIVCTGEEIVPPPPSINVNFADVMTPDAQGGTLSNPDADIPATAGTYGLAPAPGNTWANLRPATTGTDGTETVTTAYACVLDTPVRVSYKASGTYEYTGFAEAPVDAVLRYYLDDGTSQLNGTADGVQRAGADIYVTNIPFSKYDAIVYLATDNGEVFTPVEINGKLYKGAKSGAEEALLATDTWGTAKQTTPALGVNALRVSGLKGNLRIKGGTRQNKEDGKTAYARSGIAAFQIVLADDGEILETVDPDRGVLSLNFNSGRNNAAVPDTNAFYGLDAVPGWAWYDSPKNYGNDGSTAITSEETVSTAYGSVLESSPRVTISAANGYFYSSNDPFMRAYLDDNARVNISSEVPYDYYDVIVYSATDGTESRFQAVEVNGTDYRWNADQGKPVVAGAGELFGWGGRDAAFGQNAQRINGQTANPLTIAPRDKNGDYRSGIAAIQIIERPVQEIKVSTEMTAQEVFAQALPGRATKLAFAEGGAITGAVNLSGVAVDLTQVTPSPFTGNLTVDANTKLYLPANTSTYTLTAGTVAGTLAAANVFIGGTAIPAGAMTQNGADLTFNIEITYNWTGAAGDNLWSTPDNWSSGVAPDENSTVTVNLNADDAKTITLDKAATVASLTITGPASGSATLTIQAAEGVEGAKLTVSGRMLATGNVTVTQEANITVNGETKVEVINEDFGISGSTQAGFHVHQGTWQIRSGTLSMPTEGGTNDGGTNIGEAGISGNGTLIVGGEGASEATLAVRQIRTVYYNKDTGLANGTLRVATGGTLTASDSVQLPGQSYTTELAGGTIETPTLITFAGATVSADSSLRAPTGRTATVETQSGSFDALTGTGGVTLSGTVTIESALTGYTGTLTVSAGSALTLSDDARPRLVLVSGATEAKTSLTVTPTIAEAGSSTIVFPTTMTTEPENVTYTVSGVTKAITVTVNDNEDTLTLSWGADYPTLSTSGDWSTGSWKTSAGTTNAPSEGSAILDGTQAAITVTLDTNLSEMTSIFVKGKVTLETTGTQATIPACVALAEGATLTIDANFSGLSSSNKWTLPDGTTLQVTKGFTSFAYLTLEGEVVILKEASGTDASPTKIAATGVEFNGGLTIAASNLTLESVYNVGKTLALAGDNITIAGNRFFTDTGTQVVNTGTDNAITGMTGLNGSLEVKGTLALTLGASPTNTFSGATIAEDATLTLAGPDNAQEWWFPVTGAGTLVLEGAIRPMFAAVSGSPTLPKTMVFTATEAEQAAGVISCLNWQNGATLPEGLTVTVYPAEGGGAWAPTAVLDQNSYLRIYNQLPTNLPVGVKDAIADIIQQDATTAGITKGYTVQLTTKGQPVEVTADMLNDVLGCFTGLKATANAEGTTLTYAYDFGITGIKRNTADNGWVVTAKVQGENAEAGFAEGNVYTLTVNGAPAADASATVGENGTVTFTVPDASVAGDAVTLGVKVSRPAPTSAQ